jgi:RNA recognition motif-containing protein
MNYAQSVDVFNIYADMVTSDRSDINESNEHYICAYAARKDGYSFSHTDEEIMERYGSNIVMRKEMPPIDWPSMGRYVYMARFKEKEEMDRYFNFVLG